MKGQKCPVCEHYTYFIEEGEYDSGEFGVGGKITPDLEWCSYCGFQYDESVDYNKDYNKMIEKYKVHLKDIIKTDDKSYLKSFKKRIKTIFKGVNNGEIKQRFIRRIRKY